MFTKEMAQQNKRAYEIAERAVARTLVETPGPIPADAEEYRRWKSQRERWEAWIDGIVQEIMSQVDGMSYKRARTQAFNAIRRERGRRR